MKATISLLGLGALGACQTTAPEQRSVNLSGSSPSAEEEGCGASGPVGLPGLYVNASAEEGGDGSEARPLRSIQEALDLAAPGAVIYVSEGVYTESLVLSEDVTLVGAGADLVTLDGSDGARASAALDVTGGAEVAACGLRVTGGRHYGVLVHEASRLTLHDARVSDNAWANVVAKHEGAEVELQDVWIGPDVPGRRAGLQMGLVSFGGAYVSGARVTVTDSVGYGLWAGSGGELRLEDSSVVDTHLTAEGEGAGVLVTTGADLSLVRVALEGNERYSLLTNSTWDVGSPISNLQHVLLQDVVIRDMVPVALDGEEAPYAGGIYAGTGVINANRLTIAQGPRDDDEPAYISGVFAWNGARVHLEEPEFTGALTAGVSSMGMATDVSVTGGELHDLDDGQGNSAGAVVFAHGSLSLDRVDLRGIADTGVSASDEGTVLDGSDVQVSDAPSGVQIGHGATATLDGLRLVDLRGSGLVLLDGGDVWLGGGSVIEGISSIEELGVGVGILVGDSGVSESATRLSIDDAVFTGVEGLGVLVSGVHAAVSMNDVSFVSGGAGADPQWTPAAINVTLGASADLVGVKILDQEAVGLLVDTLSDGGEYDGDMDTVSTVTATDLHVEGIPAIGEDPAVGVAAQALALVELEDAQISGVEGAALYANNSQLECAGCTISDVSFAGLVSRGISVTGLDGAEIDATGAPFGVLTLADGVEEPVTLIHDTQVSSALLASVLLYGPGTYYIDGATLSGSVGDSEREVLLNGNGVFAAGGVTSWDDDALTGLLIERSTITDQAGPAVLLVNSAATLCGNTFDGNPVDLAWQNDDPTLEPEWCETDHLTSEANRSPSYGYTSPEDLQFVFEPQIVSIEDI